MTKHNFLWIIIPGLVMAVLMSCGGKNNNEVTSPDGNINVTVYSDGDQVFYDVSSKGDTVLAHSLLGIVREDADFSKKLKICNISKTQTVLDDYTLVAGKKRHCLYKANKKIFSIKNAEQLHMDIIFQVSDHGVAFRYYFPDNSKDIKKIKEEVTSFHFTGGSRAWLQPCADAKSGWGRCNPSYEEHYLQGIPTGTPGPYKAGWVFPALFSTDSNTWVLISETAVDAHYCAARLRQESPDRNYSIGFPQKQEVSHSGELNPGSKLPWYTPWRIIAIGSLGDVVESTLGTDLANPAINGDFSWVKPGRASWSWVLLKDNMTIFPVQKAFIDYASDMGWEYCLIDAGWDVNIGYDSIQQLIDYGKAKNVGVLLWYNSSGDWNDTPQTPKSKLLTREQRLKEFQKIKDMGVAGVKVDFFSGDGQSVIRYYTDILEDAAKVQLAVNFHGCTLPRGWQRTYPHLLSMEAIKGFEYVTFAQPDADLQANHSAMAPFARNVFDPMDFTPVCFSEIYNIKRKTSNAFELATAVIFQSGIQHYAETPEGMAAVPDFVKQTMKEIPVLWDETRFVGGFPGKYIILARRAGNRWYVAGINGEDSGKTINISLPFIDNTKGLYIHDGENDRSFMKEDLILDDKKGAPVNMKPEGGFLLVF